MLDTRDLARLDVAARVPERAWTQAVRRRCGNAWCSGRAGVIRLYVAVHAACVHPHRLSTRFCAGMRDACLQQICACLVGTRHLATGNEYGLTLGRTGSHASQIWFGQQVISVACLHDETIWFCTAAQRAYAYVDCHVEPLYADKQVLCVSGPVGIVGTVHGTFPVLTLPMPCARIAQSATLVATWHMNGHVCTLDPVTLARLHTFDVGHCMGQSLFSVIGDIVRVSGVTWRNGRCYGTCPYDTRESTPDGTIVIVHRANIGVNVIT